MQLAPIRAGEGNLTSAFRTGWDWTATAVRSRSCTWVCVHVYMTVGNEGKKDNFLKMREILSFLLHGGRPFLIGGGWNQTPAELCETGWVSAARSTVLCPDLDATVLLPGGRLDDFFVSPRLGPTRSAFGPSSTLRGRRTSSWRPASSVLHERSL